MAAKYNSDECFLGLNLDHSGLDSFDALDSGSGKSLDEDATSSEEEFFNTRKWCKFGTGSDSFDSLDFGSEESLDEDATSADSEEEFFKNYLQFMKVRSRYDEGCQPEMSINDSDSESVDLESKMSSGEEYFTNTDDDYEEDNSEDIDSRKWCKVNMENISPPPPRFPFKEKPGITVDMNPDAKPLEYFELFFDETLLQIIVRETNAYADQHIKMYSSKTLHEKWTPTNEKELRLLFGLIMLEEVNKMPLRGKHWVNRKIFYPSIVPKLMRRSRYNLLMKFLHFCNNEEFNNIGHPYPKLRKFYVVMEYLRKRFYKLYIPEQTLGLDEGLFLSNGVLGCEINTNKVIRFKLKFFMICEQESGYICNFLIYAGGDKTVYNKKYDSLPIRTKTVFHLMDHFLGKGYCITVNYKYMSPDLVDLLVKESTDVFGTVLNKTKGLPEEFSKEKVKRGEIQAFQHEKVMALKWHHKKKIWFMSTIHNASSKVITTSKGQEVMKPNLVCDVNYVQNGVHHCNQRLDYYRTICEHQEKYCTQIFRYFIDQVVWNSYILYNKTASKNNINLIEYRLQLIEQSFEYYAGDNSRFCKEIPRIPSLFRRFNGRHFPYSIPSNSDKMELDRHCIICCSNGNESRRNIEKEIIMWCKNCQVALCRVPCFKIFHTLENSESI